MAPKDGARRPSGPQCSRMWLGKGQESLKPVVAIAWATSVAVGTIVRASCHDSPWQLARYSVAVVTKPKRMALRGWMASPKAATARRRNVDDEAAPHPPSCKARKAAPGPQESCRREFFGWKYLLIPSKSGNFAPAKMSRGSSLRVCMLISPQISLILLNMVNSQVCHRNAYQYHVLSIFIRIGV